MGCAGVLHWGPARCGASHRWPGARRYFHGRRAHVLQRRKRKRALWACPGPLPGTAPCASRVARAMAEGGRERTRRRGARDRRSGRTRRRNRREKPVGTVWIALAPPRRNESGAAPIYADGSPESIRAASVSRRAGSAAPNPARVTGCTYGKACRPGESAAIGNPDLLVAFVGTAVLRGRCCCTSPGRRTSSIRPDAWLHGQLDVPVENPPNRTTGSLRDGALVRVVSPVSPPCSCCRSSR